MSYCSFARQLPKGNHHRIHHDTEHGTPPIDDDDLFRRLMLEVSQAGLSFDIALKRKSGIYKAFPGVKKVAAYSGKDILLQNPGIIRNKRKIEAAIYNAKKIVELQRDFGSLRAWLDSIQPANLRSYVRAFRIFKFAGPEIVKEFLMSACYLPGAHDKDCHKIFKQV